MIYFPLFPSAQSSQWMSCLYMQKTISLHEITYTANYWWSAHTEWHHLCTMPICWEVRRQSSNIHAYSPFWGGSLFCTKSNKDTLPEGLGGATVSSSLSPRFLLSRSSAPFDFASARKRSLSRWLSSRLTPSCFYVQNTTSIIPSLLTRDVTVHLAGTYTTIKTDYHVCLWNSLPLSQINSCIDSTLWTAQLI